MSRRVLLVDADVDALGALAEALRTRGLTVQLASEPFDAVEIAFQSRPEVILVAAGLDKNGELTDALRAVPELALTPVLRLVDDAESAAAAPEHVLRSELDQVISRVTGASPRELVKALPQEIRGTLEQVSPVDLLQLLAMNKRSGVLTVLTAGGAGEVRVLEGEIVDAMLRRLEGEKALFRLLGERDGSFAFLPAPSSRDGTDPPRRISSPTSMLIMESMRQLDEVGRRRAEIAPDGEMLLVDEAAADELVTGGVAAELVKLLENPRSVDEVLDEIAAPDLEVLSELATLVDHGLIRRISRSELTTPFAAAEQSPMLRALVTRLATSWYAPPRVVVATSAKRLPALAHAIRRITDSLVPTEIPPRIALPRWVGTLRLGDGVELSVIGLPTEESLSPTWSLALPGAIAVVRLDDAGGTALEAHCKAVEIQLVDAEGLIGEVDPADPAQIAALLRSTLEMVAGV